MPPLPPQPPHAPAPQVGGDYVSQPQIKRVRVTLPATVYEPVQYNRFGLPAIEAEADVPDGWTAEQAVAHVAEALRAAQQGQYEAALQQFIENLLNADTRIRQTGATNQRG